MSVAKILRYGLIGVLVLLVTVIVGAVVALQLIDFNRFKPLIAEAARNATGRELTIAGDLHLDISLTPGIIVDDVTLSNAEWGSRPNMVSVKRLEADFALIPLILGVVEIKRIGLTGADILLETDLQGRANFEFAPPGAEATAPTRPGDADAAIRSIPLVDEADIRDSRVTYISAATGNTYSTIVDSLTLDRRGLNEPTRVDFVGKYNGVPVQANARLGTIVDLLDPVKPWPVDLVLDASGATVAVIGSIAEPLAARGFDLSIKARGDQIGNISNVAGAVVPPLGAYSISARLTGDLTSAIKISGLAARLGDSDVAGDAQVNLSGEHPAVEARLTADNIDLAALGAGSAPLRDTVAVFTLKDNKLLIESIKANLSGGGIVVAGTIAEPTKANGLNLTIAATGEQFGELSALSGADIPRLGAYSISARVAGDATSTMTVSALTAQLGDSDVSGDVQVTLSGDHPAVDARLTSRKIDLAALGIGKAPLRDTAAVFTLKDKNLRFESFKAKLSSAAITIAGTIAEPATASGLDLTITAKGEQFGGLSELTGEKMPALGRYALATRLAGDAASTIRLSDFTARVGESDLAGQATVILTSERPFIDADISSNKIVLPVLIGVAGDGSKTGQAAAKPDRIFPDDPLSLEGLKAVDAKLRFNARTVTGRGSTVRNTTIILSLKDGNLDVQSFSAETPNGTLKGVVQIYGGTRTARLVVRATLRKVDLATLLAETSYADSVSGKVNFDFDLAGRGNSVRQIMASLDGRASLAMGQGRIRSRVLQTWVGGPRRILSNALSLNVGGYSEISCALGEFVIKKGLATTNGFLLDTDVAAFVGRGTIDLRTEGLNLTISPHVKKFTLSAAVPVHIRGTLANPKYSLDNTAVARKVGGVLGSLVYPPALIFGLGELGTSKDGDCAGQTADGATGPEQAQPTTEQQPARLPGKILKGTGETITKGLKGIFGQ